MAVFLSQLSQKISWDLCLVCFCFWFLFKCYHDLWHLGIFTCGWIDVMVNSWTNSMRTLSTAKFNPELSGKLRKQKNYVNTTEVNAVLRTRPLTSSGGCQKYHKINQNLVPNAFWGFGPLCTVIMGIFTYASGVGRGALIGTALRTILIKVPTVSRVSGSLQFRMVVGAL